MWIFCQIQIQILRRLILLSISLRECFNKKKKQAGAELCQAQVLVGLPAETSYWSLLVIFQKGGHIICFQISFFGSSTSVCLQMLENKFSLFQIFQLF
jgi:hypothetical protein